MPQPPLMTLDVAGSLTYRVATLGRHPAYGLTAARSIDEGEHLFHVDGLPTEHPSRHSIQIDERTHIDLEPSVTLEEAAALYPWRFLNHSCEPNTALRGLDFVALRPIAAGEDLTYNYNTTEFDMAAPFDCWCGHDRCIGRVSGFAHLSSVEQTRLLPWLSLHLRRRTELMPPALLT